MRIYPPHCLLGLLLTCLNVPADAKLPRWLSAAMAGVGVPEHAVAVHVRQAGTGRIVVSHRADKSVKPASIIKVLTTFCALEILGETYTWQTPMYVTGSLDQGGGTLRGNVIFRGVGDPSLSPEKLRDFATGLVRRGIRTIEGKIIMDETFFGFDYAAPDQYYNNSNKPWNVPPQPLQINGTTGGFIASFRDSFEQAGGRVAGNARSSQNARLYGSIPSLPLMEILFNTNKSSNNLYARQLFLAVGAYLTGEPPSPSGAANALHKWISQRIPETESFVLVNGSGLSHDERVTAEGMVALFDYIRESEHGIQFLETLPIVGKDGTMRRRLKGEKVEGRSVVKTGTLRDVTARSGVLFSERGRVYSFAIIVNHANAVAASHLLDQFIKQLHNDH